MTDFHDFKGAATPLADADLPRLGALIGVGEDELHAFMDAETSGRGFDAQGRPKMLFEPHVFWRLLGAGPKRDAAVAAGLAYQKWGSKPYPADSYPRLDQAIAIDETCALQAASWGIGQIMGENAVACGFLDVQHMVLAFMDSEPEQLHAVITFLTVNKLADKLKAHDWAAVARGYNGPGYAKNGYDKKLAANFAKWQAIKDTPMPDTTITAPLPVEPPVLSFPTAGVTPVATTTVTASHASILDTIARAAAAGAQSVLSAVGGAVPGLSEAGIVASAVGAAFAHPDVQAAASTATSAVDTMPATKPWYASLGVWGSILAMVAPIVGGVLGLNIDQDVINEATRLAGETITIGTSAVGLIGGAVALWGRIRAKKAIAPKA